MSVTLTRKELYDCVWEEPVDTLAKDYGLSNVGLGKACRRHDIPVPPRGYLHYVASKKAKGHWLCPCGSTKRPRDCHAKQIADLRERIPRRIAASALKHLNEYP